MPSPVVACHVCRLPIDRPALVIRLAGQLAILCHRCRPAARRAYRVALTSRPRVTRAGRS